MLEQILKRDRLVVLGGVVGLSGLAWLELWRHAGAMAMHAAMPHAVPWRLPDLAAAALMWAVMMVAMMLPSTAPLLLLFATLQRKRREQEQPATPTGCFAAGYLLVWLALSGLAAALQWALQALLLLWPHLTASSSLLGGGLLILAGAYQFTPWKNACLSHCQSPLGFFLTRWREGPGGAFRMGLHHGAYCLGCCWALMGLLFVGGVMNLVLVAAIAGFVLLEKAVASGLWLSRVAGALCIGWGAYLLHAGLTS